MKQQVILQRWHVKNIDEKEKRTEVFEKNRILAIKVGNDKWKVVVGDGKTSLGKLPLQETFAYNPNEIYTSGVIELLSHYPD